MKPDKSDMKSDAVDAIVDYGSSALGATAGAAIGGVVAGPFGAVAGSLAGTAIERTFERLGSEFKERVLSKAEDRRVGAVMAQSAKLVKRRLDAGDRLRGDGFFDAPEGGRSVADEVCEGVLLAAQREYEELKQPYLARMYANLAFEPAVSRAMANRLVKISEELTYRQLLIIHAVAADQSLRARGPKAGLFKRGAYTAVHGATNVAIASETFDLYRMSVLGSEVALFDSAGIDPSKLSVIGYGVHLLRLMKLNSLVEVPENVELLREILSFMTGSVSRPSGAN